jgi:hypothetical protein
MAYKRQTRAFAARRGARDAAIVVVLQDGRGFR